MTTLSQLSDNEKGNVYYQTYIEPNRVDGSHYKQPSKYMGDTIGVDGKHLKHFKLLNPPFFSSRHYIPEDNTFDLKRISNLHVPDELHLKISEFLGNSGGKKGKSKRKRIRKNKNKKSKRRRK
jgi:hypothetical protein